MSKIIVKKDLDLVIESTLKEVGYVMEAKDELKITKNHMDELHKEGHCMCDNKCLVYIEDISGDVKKTTELMQKLASEKMDCVFITKEQMDMLHKDGKCDCDDNVSLSYDDEMKEGDYMDNMEDNMCSECGGGMSEGKCNECGDKDVVESSLSSLSESINQTTKKEFLKEEMDHFNKLINHRK